RVVGCAKGEPGEGERSRRVGPHEHAPGSLSHSCRGALKSRACSSSDSLQFANSSVFVEERKSGPGTFAGSVADLMPGLVGVHSRTLAQASVLSSTTELPIPTALRATRRRCSDRWSGPWAHKRPCRGRLPTLSTSGPRSCETKAPRLRGFRLSEPERCACAPDMLTKRRTRRS